MASRVAPAPEAPVRTSSHRRRQTFKLELSASDMWELQKTRDDAKMKSEYITPYIPLISGFLWLLIGSLFYAYADGFGIVYGFYQSVNIGWSLGWVTPIETSSYQSVGSNVFTIIHTSIGVMFIGIAVIYIAKQATESKDSWMMEVVKQDKLNDAANTEGIWDDIVAAVETYSSKYKIIVLWVLWLIAGLIFGVVSVDEWDTSIALDFVLSSVSGGGYLSLPAGSSKWKYFFIALYTGIGMPITSISIGLIISLALISNDSKAYYEAICSVITDRELSYMKIFGIDDGDGTIDNREYILLIAVRFGAASPGLLGQIKERFEELDRERTGYIKYDDLIKGRRKRKVTKRFQKVLNTTAFKMSALMGSNLPRSDSFTATSKPNNMYGSSGDMNEADEESQSGSQIICQHVNSSSQRIGDDDASTSYHFGSPSKESQQDKIKGNSDESKDSNPERLIASAGNGIKRSNVESDSNNKDITSCPRNDSASFYKVTKAAQMWKSKSDVESNKPPESSSKLPTTPSAASLAVGGSSEQAPRTKTSDRPNRRETFVDHRSKSFMDANVAKVAAAKNLSIQWLLAILCQPVVQSLIAWFLWLFFGTIFYAVHEERNLGEALYYSISVGYGIFWLSVDDNVMSATFTRIHFCLGMVAIGMMMAAFASVLVDSKTKWYVEAMKVKALEEAGNTEGYWDDIVAFFKVYGPKMRIHVLFLLWVFIGVLWSCLAIKWPLIEGVFFSVSALTTGGLWPIPENSPEWHYAFAAFYVVGGVPVMAISLGMIANSVSEIGGSRILDQKISARITDEEITMMESFGIVDDDGSIDAKEFAILTLVRIGVLQPSLICMIHERFEEIDVKKTGSITYTDLKNYSNSKMSAVGKNLAQTGHVNRKLGFK